MKVLSLMIVSLLTGCSAVDPTTVRNDSESGQIRLVVTDDSDNHVDPSVAKTDLKHRLESGEKLPIKIFLTFWIGKDLDTFGDMEIWYSAACSVEGGGTKLTSEAKPLFESGVTTNKAISIGEVFSTNVASEIDAIRCRIKLIEDDGLSESEGEAANKLSKDLGAFVQGVGTASSVATWIPIAPIALNILDVVLADEELRTATVSLLREDGFAPDGDTVLRQGGGVQTAFVVRVGPYRYAKADTMSKPAVKDALENARAETDLRFKSILKKVDFYPVNGSKRAQVNWTMKPLIKDDDKGTHIINGLSTVHNEDMWNPKTSSGPTDKTCQEIESCIDSKIWWGFENSPIILRGSTDGSDLPWWVDIPNNIKRLRLFWMFIQKEADNGNTCITDDSKPRIDGKLPHLKVIDKNGATVNDVCYYSAGEDVVVVE